MKKKILLGYGAAFAFMSVVIAWAVLNLVSLGKASDAILRENYWSILAAENMLDALERQDSGVLILLLGDTRTGTTQFRGSEAVFLQWPARAKDNVTISGEAEEHMDQKQILVVDDEKNIRMTMAQSLEPLGMPVRTAVNGEEALQVLGEDPFGLVFLDLKMPGMDGLHVLRRIKDEWPRIRVIIITAHGTIQSAVDAMKLGAVDFIQKPFSPGEIREIATQVVEREALDEESATDYTTLMELAKRHITDRSFDAARAVTQRAIASDPAQPGAYNLYGALLEIRGDRLEAQKFYRASLDIDPTYQPARANLARTTSWHKFGQIQLEPRQEEVKPRKE